MSVQSGAAGPAMAVTFPTLLHEWLDSRGRRSVLETVSPRASGVER